jgi:DNA-binding LytR/AlgR family response regulator
MANKLTAVIADDEVTICDALRRMLRENLDIDVLAVCHDGDAAKEMIEKTNPDIAFLDIRMPGLSGIEVTVAIEDMDDPPMVVFITAYDDYAIKAFEVKALDYVLKPFSLETLSRTISKMTRITSKSTKIQYVIPPRETQERTVRYPSRFCVVRDDKSQIVGPDEIQFIYAENRGVFLQTVEGTVYSTRMTILDFEDKLDPTIFFRSHRSFIVNMQHAKEISSGFNRDYILTLKGPKKSEVPVSRAKISQLSKYICF